ncbi:MAG: hypothetical protein LC105_13275 [Chitinophagales bacterium]|nr:hypothetical protein [Chitinophagales bacterium]MCZ2394828.1 hypothetical protein [Chitinophagales bacterium]
MDSLQQQILYTIVGTLKLSKDKFKELMEDLIQNPQYAHDEGKRITMDVMHQFHQFKNELEMKINMKIDETKMSIHTPMQEAADKMIKDLKKKIQDYSISQLLSSK